jgi:hypothetical protein
MSDKLVEEAPYHPGYEDVGFSKAKDRFPNYESICLQCGTTIYKPFKEITDEEIRKVADEVFKDYKNWHHYQIDFARAVLKKASENG